MRKILLATNANNIKMSAIDFGCYIANLTKSPLTGVFLEKRNKVAKTLIPTREGYEYITAEDATANTNIFCNRCLHNDARYSVHHVYGNPLTEAIKESLYADVILADGNTSFNEDDGWPSQFIKDLLEDAKCPVIVTPFDFDEINEVVFAYDGTDSSIFAMKQFIYLFPQLNDIKITLLQVLKEDNDITEKKRLKEFMMMYFDAVHYDTLRGDADTELFKKFLAQRNKILVMGAYGRKKFFSHSTADILLKTLNIPIFIAHY